MSAWRGAVAALCLALPPFGVVGSETADPGFREVGQFGAWDVRVVERRGEAAFCMARSGGDDRFVALYAPAKDRLRMQFFSDRWALGEGGRIALTARVDGGAPWALGDATGYRQSVLFDLPQSRAGADFLKALMRGRALTVSDAKGARFGRYDLHGSGAAVAALATCVRGL